MTKIWFTADTHFGHRNVIRHDRRPFKASNCSCDPDGAICLACVDKMDECIIENWNSQVKPGDVVWHLGDLCFRSHRHPKTYLAKLNGRINIVWGNHDDSKGGALECSGMFDSCQDYKYLRVNGQKIVLFHYKMEVWRASGRGAWHLYGHSHGNIKPKVNCEKVANARDQIMCILSSAAPELEKYSEIKDILDSLATPVLGKSLDVGIMNHGYKLLSFEEIEFLMKGRELTDHHAEQE